MFYVYVLKSTRNGKRYIGWTRKNVADRVKEHNQGSNKFTRENAPFKLCYYEHFARQRDAVMREKFFKSGQGRAFLDKLLSP